MKQFSFIDYGHKDFVRNHEGETLILPFESWDAADDFIMSGGLDEYGWSNDGTKKLCWDDNDDN